MDLSSTSIESFKQDFLQQINKYRNNHGSQKLINDKNIDKIAQKFAQKLAKTGKLDYSSNEYKDQILGESVYKSKNYLAPLKLAKILYDEISEYDFKSNDPEPNNFSQMVWKNTDSIGFGMAKSSNGNFYYVINYFPTGNVDGEFKSNVFPEGTKVLIEAGNKHNKKEISKNESDSSDEDKKKSNKYIIKKVVKEYSNNKGDIDFDKELEEFNKNFNDIDIDDEEEDDFEFNINKKETKDKDIDRKNILSELIKNKKKQNSRENDNKIINDTQNITNSDFNKFCLEALEYHNKYRKLHHVPPLKLNKEICLISENYAKTLATKLKCLQHSENIYKDEELGENLYCCFGMEATGREISTHWYNEIKKYNFKGDWQSGCGHFTQMIWKDTKEVGFGKWKDKKGNIYVVANYFPAGNVMGFFKYNVFKQ